MAFVWNDKRQRLAYDTLRRNKAEGGLGLPDIALYYKAMALVQILNWCHDTHKKLWVQVEKSMVGRDLAGAPWIQSLSRGLSQWKSPLTQNTLEVWDKLNKSGKYAHWISPLAPPPGEETGYLGAWGRDGDSTCGRFAPGGVLQTLTEVVSRLGSLHMAEWKYNQIMSFLNKSHQ